MIIDKQKTIMQVIQFFLDTKIGKLVIAKDSFTGAGVMKTPNIALSTVK